MTFGLGERAEVGRLRATEIVAGTIDVETLNEGVHCGSHLKIGNATTKNTSSINQTDSLLHVNYAFYLHVLGGNVTDGSSILKLITTTAHNLKAGDPIEIEHVSTTLGDFTFEELSGEQVCAAGTEQSTIRILLPRQSVFTDDNTEFTCGVHGTHYKYIDLADDSDTTTWTRATVLPTPKHANVNPPAAWAPY